MSLAVAGAAALAAGCNTESTSPDDERPAPEDATQRPDYGEQAVTTAQVQQCLAAPGFGGNLIQTSQFGGAIQAATSTAAQAGYPAGDCYLVVSGGDAANWNTSGNVQAQNTACQSDPVFGTLCDVGGVDVVVQVPVGATKITMDYRFFEWDYVPFEDPFSITLFNAAGQPVASTGSQNTCEFVNKGGSDLAIGNIRQVAFSVSGFQGQQVTLQFRASDRYDHILDAGGLVNNLQIVGGAMPCGSAVCGGCANAANCAAINADGDAYNSCTDCNDNNAQAYPGAPEICNGQDDNCSGVADEGGVCCVDNDSDGYTGCNGDCNDGNAAVHPGAAETCDGVDNDCNGEIDFISNVPVCAPPDDDGDGYNQNDDCDDGDPAVYPGASELCDFKDNDCDGVVDDGSCVPSCVTLNGANTAMEDALLSGDYPSSAQGPYFGMWTGLSSGGNINYSVLKWGLAGLPQGPNVYVTSASIDVWVGWNAAYNQVSVHRALAPWSEATVTYNNYLGNWEVNSVSSFDGGGQGHRTADVTDLADAWLRGEAANNGIVLAEAPVNRHYFYSAEAPATAEKWPALSICYFVAVGN